MTSKTASQSRRGAFQFLGDMKGVILIFMVALYFYFLAGTLMEPVPPGQLGPYFWPRWILILIMVSCGVKGLEVAVSGGPEQEGTEKISRPAVNYPRLLMLIGLLLGVVAAMEVIGFLLANLLFLLLFMYAAGMRKTFRLVTTSVVGTLALLYLFVKVVYLPLPKGSWHFDDLTIFLYRLLHLI